MAKKRKPKRSRACIHCRKRFVPDDARRTDCKCPFCGETTGKAKSLAWWIKRADALFSRLVRWIDPDTLEPRTHAKCVTCGAMKGCEDLQCGHYIERGWWATRWSESNCWPQCGACNMIKPSWHGGRPWQVIHDKYRVFLVEQLGEDEVLEMEASQTKQRRDPGNHKPRIPELRGMCQSFEAVLRAAGLGDMT